jgi:hypothetical protein
MTTYTWTITSLYTKTVNGEQDYVVVAHYNVKGVDGNYSFTINDTARFSTEKTTPFVPYSDLTNDIVIGWVKQELGENGVNSILRCIDGAITSKKTPPVVPQNTPLPWATPVTNTEATPTEETPTEEPTN